MIWLLQLAFDCADPDAVTKFWGQALEYRNPLVGVPDDEIRTFRREHPQFDGRGRIDDNELRRMPVYIQRVPEAKDGTNRVRPEVSVARASFEDEVGRLRALGATEAADGGDERDGIDFRDIEDNEFSLVPSDADTAVRLRSVVIDSLDPERLVAFWADATGYTRSGNRCDPSSIVRTWTGTAFEVDGLELRHTTGTGAVPGPAPYDLTPGLAFVETKASKTAKNRLHLDLHSTDAEGDRDRLVALGATVLQWDTDHVLADPEGNEFCLGGRPPTRATPRANTAGG